MPVDLPQLLAGFAVKIKDSHTFAFINTDKSLNKEAFKTYNGVGNLFFELFYCYLKTKVENMSLLASAQQMKVCPFLNDQKT